MKKIAHYILPIAAIIFMALQPVSDPLPIGSLIPGSEIKMKAVNGKEISLAGSFKEKGLLVMFSCNTCSIVRTYQQRIRNLVNYADANKVGIILLNSCESKRTDGESFEDMQQYAKEQGYSFDYALDTASTIANAFGATRTPEVFLFNKDKKLVYHGGIDDNADPAAEEVREHARIAIMELIDGKEVFIKKTNAIGCGIKRVVQ